MGSAFIPSAVSGFLVLALSGAPATAQAATDFYRGKTISILVGATPGGGYDAYGRLLARFLGAHIPGAPKVIVQNMPGAGSLTSVLYLNTTAPKDGTAMTLFNPGVMTDAIINPSKARVNFTTMTWVGSVTPDYRICYTWHASGIKTWDDFKRPREVTLGAAGGQSSLAYNDVNMLHNLFGLHVRGILGYPGRSEVHLAIERGELDGECGSISGLPENWLREHKINIPVRMVDAAMPGVPDTVPYIGQFTKNDEERGILRALTAANYLGRPFIVAKQVPADRLKILRDGFNATMKDKDFLDAAKKQELTVGPTTGEEAEKRVRELYNVSPELAAKARAAIK